MHGVRGGEPLGYAARFNRDNALCGFEDMLDREHNLVDTPLKGCRDLFVHEGSSSLSYENVLPNPLEHAHVSIVSSPPSSSSPELAFEVPISISKICDANVDLGNVNTCLICLVGKLKILSP